MSAKKNLFASVSVLALSFGFAQSMHAAPCASGSGVTIATKCTGPVTWTGGRLDVLNSGVIELGATGVGVGMGVITGTLTNDGTVSGTAAGLVNSLGGIDTILNRGRIYVEGDTAVANSGTISELINSGEIVAINTGLLNSGTIGSLTNRGRISGSMGILDVSGTILTFDNASGGTINGGATALLNAGGSIGSLTNGGLISGGAMGIMIDSGTITTIINARGGTISGSTASGIYNAGIYSYSGNIGTLTNSGVVNGSISGFAQYLSRIDALNNDDGGTISGDSYGVLNSNSTIVTFTNASGGLVDGGVRGISNSSGGVIEQLTNAGAIIGGTTGIRNSSGSIGTLSNSGQISGSMAGIQNNSGTIQTITNTVSGMIGDGTSYYGLSNSSGLIDWIINGGTIAGSAYGIYSTNSTIGSLDNAGSISGQSDGIFIDGGILAHFTNAITGTIAGVTNGFHSDSALQSDWSNAGRIMATGSTSAAGVFFEGGGGIGTVTNTGSISGTETGMRNQRSITAFNNSGELRGGHTGLFSQGGIDTITNSGTILADTHDSAQAVNLSNGVFGTFTNTASGLINGSPPNGEGILVQYSTLDLLENYGSIMGGAVGVDAMGTIGTIVNAGLIKAVGGGSTAVGVYISESLGLLTNSGTIVGGTTSGVGVFNGGTITVLNNSGLITHGGSTGDALANFGTIDTIENTGTIAGNGYAIYSVETLGTVTNSGVIAGNIFSSSASNLMILGGSNDEFGTLTAGTVTNTASNVVFASGNLVIEDAFDVGSHTVVNSGAVVSANSVISITGNFSQSAGMWSVGSAGELVVSGTANVSGGIILASLPSSGTYVAGESRTLISAASGSSYSGVDVSVALTGLWLDVNKASTDSLVIRYLNSYVGGSVGTFTNAGTVSGSYMGLFVASGGNVGTLLNTGNLGGSVYAMYNAGHIDTLDNRGAISDGSGLFNTGSIGTLSNSGLIDGDIGLKNSGTIGTIANSGTITGPDYAIYNTGTLGVVANTGTIAGNILSTATADITITGGSGSAFGTLTGGTITAPGITFTSGNTALNDKIDVGSGTVVNSGATLQLSGAQNITGKFSQTAGVLSLGPAGELIVSGTAAISGGSVQAGLDPTGNYLAGTGSTAISAAAGSSYTGVTVGTSLTGLDVAASSSSTTDLVLSYRNHYVGGTLASLTNTGATGSVYGLYIASSGNLAAFNNSGTLSGSSYAIYNSGSLGQIVNTGTIVGNILSTSAANLTIDGGLMIGTLTGGTITNAASDVVFASGNLLLQDAIDVGTHQVTNSGATIALSSNVAVTGKFSQTGGTIALGDTGQLAVSGTATMTGGSVDAALLSTANYIAGQSRTLVSAASGSSYSGLTVNSSLTGLDVAASMSSTKDLVLSYRNTYVGGTLASLTNTGAAGSVYGLYIASSGNLAAFSNSGTLSGSSYAIYSAGTLGLIANTGTISGNVRSVTALSIAGGTAKGIWSGGTITAPAVTFTSGNVLLRDDIATTGTVTNSGAALEVESARTITGNYSQTGGSLVIDVASTTSYGSLVVSGGATMSNAVVQLSGSGLTYGQAYTIIDANSASNYTGVTVNAGTFFSMISVLNDDLIVRLGLPLADIGNNVGGDAAVMGGVLNGLQGNSSFGSVITALAGGSTAAQGNALKQAAPAQVGNGVLQLQRAGLITDMVDDAIGRRSGLLHNRQHGVIFWAEAMGGSARRNADGATENTDISAWGMAVGADATVGNDLMLGGAVSWAAGRNTGTGALSGNSNKINAIALTAYGAWSNGDLMVDGQAALGLNNYVQRRRIDVTSQTAEARYDGRTYEVMANVGYDVPLGSFKLTPGVSLKWLRVAADGYSEDGAGVLNLTVGDTAVDQLRSRIGARLSRSFETSVGWLRPDFSIAWQHDFIADAVTTDAGLSGVAFSTSAVRPGSDGVALGTGLSLFTAGGTVVQISYDGEFRRGYASHAGVVKFSVSF